MGKVPKKEVEEFVLKFSYKIMAEAGLHGRASARIVNKCYEYNSDISIVFNGRIGFADSIMSLLNLEAKQGDVINVIIDGEDEVEVYDDFKLFLEENL